MSKFVTTIAVDVKGVLQALPARGTPLDVRFNPEASTVEVEWDDDDFETGYTFPVEFPLELLKAGRLPKNVRTRKGYEPKAADPGRSFVLSKAPPQELPGGPVSAVRRETVRQKPGGSLTDPKARPQGNAPE